MTRTEQMRPGSESRPAGVLVVEDDEATRRCLCDQLTTLGFKVAGALTSGEEAVEQVERIRPSLVIMDIKMPGMDGIEAARLVSQRHPCPVIIVTGHSQEELMDDAAGAGVFAYLTKPVTRAALQPAIKLALARYGEFRALSEGIDNLKEALETRKLVERAKGILMKRCNVGEDEAFRMLQAHSQRENRKLKDIAEMVISASKLM